MAKSNSGDRQSFAKVLKGYRRRTGQTQVQAARMLGVSVRTLQNWEIGHRTPKGIGYTVLLKMIASE